MGNTLEKPKLTAEIVSATFQLELSKLKYQDALAGLVAFQVTRENLTEAQEKLKEARKMLTKFNEIKANGKAAALAECRWWDEAYNGTKDAFDMELAIKANQVTKIATEVSVEARRLEEQKQRKAKILTEIDNFVIAQSQAIANATTPQELVRIEQLVGSHKGNKKRYAEFLPELVAKALSLTDLIKEQKEALRKIEALKEAENAAKESGDEQAIIDAMEAQEEVTAKIAENKINAQETALNSATQSEVVEVEEIVAVAPKPRRTTIKYEIIDIKAATKAGFMKLVPDEERLEAFAKTITRKQLEEKDVIDGGVRVYLHKEY